MLPHVVTGQGYVTKVTAVNLSGVENNVAINFVNNDGTVASSTTRLLEAGETMRVQTDEALRNGPFVLQWASISAAGRIAANLFYEITDQSAQNTVVNTVGFNDDPGATSFTIPVEFEPGPRAGVIGRTVGLALSNPNNAQANVSLALRNAAGAQVGTNSIALTPYGHTQHSLDFDFANVLPAGNFIGTISGSSSAPVNVVTLGDDFGPFFATPPMTGATRTIIPHIAQGLISGLGYVTKLTLVNLSSQTNQVSVQYFDPNGLALGAPSSYTLAANGAMRVPVDDAVRFIAPTERWAVVTSSAAVAANSFFEIEDQTAQHNVVNTVGFNSSPELTDFTIPVELEPASAANSNRERTVGLVLANANGSSATVTLTLLRQDGSVLATRTRTMNANSQLLMSVNIEFAASVPAGNFVGALVVHSSAAVAASSLEADYGPFSAIPTISGRP